MAKTNAVYLRLKDAKYVPQTLTLPTIVGGPLKRGSVIRLTDEDQIDYLTGPDNSFTTHFADSETDHAWFEDVTSEYASKEKVKARTARIVATDTESSSDEDEDLDGEDDGEEEDPHTSGKDHVDPDGKDTGDGTVRGEEDQGEQHGDLKTTTTTAKPTQRATTQRTRTTAK